ncbi:hypothetical protein, partial [Mycobacterium tuberculosis]
ARSRSSGGYLLDEPPDMTPSFPRTGVSGHAGAVHLPELRFSCGATGYRVIPIRYGCANFPSQGVRVALDLKVVC